MLFNEPQISASIDTLPILKKDNGDSVYDPNDPQIIKWLSENWKFGYNPLAVAKERASTSMLLRLPDETTYNYMEPSHSFQHYRKNKDGQPPSYLGHITQTGWVEYAIKENQGMIGTDKTWTGAWDPQRWWPGKFPEGYSFQNPPERFVELIFDANELKAMGLEGKQAPNTSYYVFDGKLPLQSLVPTSKAYLTQVLGFKIPEARIK